MAQNSTRSHDDFGLFGRDGSITLDEGSHDTTSCLNTEGKGGDIEEEKVLSLLRRVTGKNGSLDCGTIRNGFVRVDALVGLFAVKEVGHEFHDTGDTG